MIDGEYSNLDQSPFGGLDHLGLIESVGVAGSGTGGHRDEEGTPA